MVATFTELLAGLHRDSDLDDAGTGQMVVVDRRHFEVCVFTYLAAELRSGDLAVDGADSYADYRAQLLPWEECEPEVVAYCRQLGLPETPDALVAELHGSLTQIAAEVDAGYPTNSHVTISDRGEPVLKRPARHEPSPSAQALEAALAERLPDRPILEVLFATAHWTGWPRHFGPLSGSEPKLADPFQRYVLTCFTYGCNLGPAQAARHLRGAASAHALGFTNRRHITAATLEAANRDLINAYHACALPRLWGDPKVAVADGTKYELVGDSLLAEYHIRYGGYGRIAYHHISDTYVALFSHFIPCGVWEAVSLIDGLLKNTSDIQPDTVHADTQGQSTTVFALAWLLGIKLMPRIRNWRDLVFYGPTPGPPHPHRAAVRPADRLGADPHPLARPAARGLVGQGRQGLQRGAAAKARLLQPQEPPLLRLPGTRPGPAHHLPATTFVRHEPSPADHRRHQQRSRPTTASPSGGSSAAKTSRSTSPTPTSRRSGSSTTT